MPTASGASRPLTAGEIAISRELFGNALNYMSVKVHNKEYLPFGMQKNDIAMTPNGEMYWPKDSFLEDFSVGEPSDQHWFMHEMVHVWQHQLGFGVISHGLLSWAAKYQYTLTPSKDISSFGMEQQACVMADYWILAKHGETAWINVTQMKGNIPSGHTILSIYQKVMTNFLANPSDRANLPGGR